MFYRNHHAERVVVHASGTGSRGPRARPTGVQHPKWTVDQLPDGTFRWTTPAGRSYDTEPTRYPI